MESSTERSLWGGAGARFARRMLAAAACLGIASAAQALTINVKTPDGVAISGGFRYTIEEDTTLDVVPDVTGLSGNPADPPTLSLAFHTSHTRIVKVGHSATASVTWSDTVAGKRYFVSVMPDNAGFSDATPTGYTMNGVPIREVNGSFPDVTVPVNKVPFKTAQISVFVFEDNAPTNGAADAPGVQEMPLCGWEVQLYEAGGTYGASGGRVSTDTFGNPLGTEYALNPDGSPQYNTDGSLKVSNPQRAANQLWTDRNGVVRIKNLSPAKYTIYSIAPMDMPSVSRCNLADANGNPTTTPIWVRGPLTAAQIANLQPGQMVWNVAGEIAPSVHGQDQSKWHQTTTIEGTWGVDAWVKSGEPAFFKEFGPPGHHVWHGFVRRFKDPAALNGSVGITGKVVNTHMSRPPGIRFYSGAPMSACWVGLTEVTAGVGLGRTVYANSCSDQPGEEGKFTITNLRANQRYQLNVWDEPLDNIIANYEFTAPASGTLNLSDVPVFSWFSNLQGKVFYDKEGTGFPFDAAGNAKPGIPQSIVNMRFRDGSIYNSTVTDGEGNYEFAEVFPFFNWLVAETDFTRFKATGATIIADNGGAVVDPPAALAGLWPAGTLTPQLQPENNNRPYRIFGGVDNTGAPVAPSSANLLQAFQGFLGQTNVIHWGKSEYNPADPNDHGGITGVVHYASTRAEFDPKFATPENNEPGIPSVEIRLYKLNNQNKVVTPSGAVIEPSAAKEQDAVQVVVSDNWNKAQPQNCVDPQPYKTPEDGTGIDFTTGPGQSKCYDGMRIWNQVRDGVFDGGWAFVDYCPNGVTVNRDANGEFVDTTCVGGNPVALPPGRYMTEGVAPYGYEHQKEEDKNVDFGDLLSPGTLANPAECMGSRSEAITYDDAGNPVAAPLLVPAELDSFPGVEIPARFRDAPNAPRPYCNKKLVVVAPGMNPFSDFHMFAKAPVAGHIVGMILDDLANEFDPYAPSFGEKYAPPFMPISIRDYAGNEINRVYSDRYGTYNALVPSTFAYNVPLPSGVAPNMVNVCLNSPTMKDPATGQTVLDPHYNPQYTQFCYVFQYLPGKTTYLDTPVLPLAAFAGPSQYALDTDQPDGTPGIKMVTQFNGTADVGGPWIPASGNRTIRIHAMGLTRVSNPLYEQTKLGNPNAGAAPKTIERDYGFGTTPGQVFIGGTAVTVTPANWSNGFISVNVPANVSGTVEVVRGDNARRSLRGVTLHSGNTNMPSGAPILVGATRGFKSIQSAIDDNDTRDGDLILVDPGLYEEAPIVWKRVRVQGYGAPATIINASMGAEPVRQAEWRKNACDLVLNKGMAAALLPGQTVPANMSACLTGDTMDNAPPIFATEEASGFFVLQKPLSGSAARLANGPFVTGSGNAAPVLALQIDGFTISGADTGGGIVANGNAIQLQISNNRITGNQGLYNGGIRIGHAGLLGADGQPTNANNLLVNIHHNEILKNGNTAGDESGGGGGISIYTGARGYRVAYNYIAGNYSTGDGGGMAHVGNNGEYRFSANATARNLLINQDNRTVGALLNPNQVSYASQINNNEFRHNQSFNQAKSVQGGGLAVVGVVDPGPNNGITLGTGSVTILSNTFEGNLAGAGDGGGIALVGVNGTNDVVALGNKLLFWNRVDILNNVIVDNGAGVAGGGISLQDAINVNIVNNTVAFNDSYATAARAFQGGPTLTDAANCANGTNTDPACLRIAQSVTQNGAGITAYGNSPGLLQRFVDLGAASQLLAGNSRWISDATLVNDVVFGNRSYHWRIDYSADQTTCSYSTSAPCFSLIGPEPQTRAGNDIAVLFPPAGATPRLSPSYSVFTAQNAADGTTGSNNRAGASGDFRSPYALGSNGSLAQLIYALEQTVVLGAPVLEVQEPTVATTAAAFDEGGNFIDVRFGPLTRGANVTVAGNCDGVAVPAGRWCDFGSYRPVSLGGNLATGNPLVGLQWPKLATDRFGRNRTLNWIRGAIATTAP